MSIAISNATSRGFDNTVHKALSTKMAWGILGSLASIILSTYYFINGNNVLSISFLISALFIPLMESYGIYSSFLQGKKKFGPLTKYYVISQIISVLSIIFTITQTKSIFLIILAYFIPWTLTRFIFYKISTQKYSQNKKVDDRAISYGKHLSLMNILSTIANQLDKLLIFHFIGAVGLAVYVIAIAPVEQIKAVFKNGSALLLPKYANQSKEEIKREINRKMLTALFVIAIGAFFYILIAPYLFNIFFSKYPSSIFLSQLFAVSLLFYISFFPNNALQAIEAKRELYKIKVAVSVLQIIFLLIGMYTMGLIGIILARIATRGSELLIAKYMLNKIRA
jgi:O-antigen/teichoic acid export membrane protein